MKYFTIIILFFLSSCQKESIIFDRRPNSDFELPLLLQINGKDCAFDAENKLLKYAILEEDLANFKAQIDFQEESEITFEGKTLRNGEVNDLGSLEVNRKYQLSIKNHQIETEFLLVFSEIPILQLVMHDPIVNEPKTLAKLHVNYPELEKSSEAYWLGVEHRGASSLKYDKKSIGFETYLERSSAVKIPRSFFDFKKNTKWILNAMYIDKSKMRDKVCFNLWNRMSQLPSEQNIEAVYIELFINNEAYGLYTLSQNYSKELLNLGTDANLYKGIESISTTRFLTFPNTPPRNSQWAGWEQVLPNPDDIIDWEAFEELAWLISEANDQEFLDKIDQIIDLENVIDYYLFVNLIRGSDSVAKNWFFLKRDSKSKFEILPWDLDVSWGRNARGDELDYELIISNGLFSRLEALNPENFNTRLESRWIELRSTIFNENFLLEMFEANFQALNDYQIISYENLIWGRNIDLFDEKNYIEEWLRNRLEVVDEYFAS